MTPTIAEANGMEETYEKATSLASIDASIGDKLSSILTPSESSGTIKKSSAEAIETNSTDEAQPSRSSTKVASDVPERPDGVDAEDDGNFGVDEPDSEAEAEFSKLNKRDRGISSFLLRREVFPPLEKRREKSDIRSKQSMLYTKLTEDRLTFLEAEIQRLEALVAPKAPVENTSPEEDSKPKAIDPGPVASIKRMLWHEFREQQKPPGCKDDYVYNNKSKDTSSDTTPSKTDEVDSKPRPKYVLEVLINSPQPGATSRLASHGTAVPFISLPSEDPKDPVESTGTENPAVNVPHGVVYRLRIRSKPLVDILRDISGVSLPESGNVVVLSPFKILVLNEDKLRERLGQLEEKHQADNIEKDAKTASSGEVETITKEASDEEEHDTSTALNHMRLLMEFIEVDLAPVFELRRRIYERTIKRIAFADLWHLFPPGTDVLTCNTGNLAHRVLKCTGGRDMTNPAITSPLTNNTAPSTDSLFAEPFVLETFSLGFDGAQYGPVQERFTIRNYAGEKDVTSLPVYPLAFGPHGSELSQRFYERGNKFIALSHATGTLHRDYTGLSLDEQPEQIDSQIIVDFQLALNEYPSLKPNIGYSSQLEHNLRGFKTTGRLFFLDCELVGCCGNDEVMQDYEIDDAASKKLIEDKKPTLVAVDDPEEINQHDRVLLPCKVYGFVLRSRKWATFHIDLVREVAYDNSGWSDLVLSKDKKKTILALVQNHARGPADASPNDKPTMSLVRGKGKGLIILLHVKMLIGGGEPGVGKTSTAECIADHTKRPLYSITCGDIGDTAAAVEENLDRTFQLAHKWGCVLLIDEADVFLGKRDRQDLRRNAVVSVFLRTLEYYSGILFLTTNRVGAIDPAFKSRIHLSLHYKTLDKATTMKIWSKQLDKAEAEYARTNIAMSINEEEILDFAERHFRGRKNSKASPWNGRQIHNAFQTALALAEYEAGEKRTPTLNSSQFKKVADASNEFDEYIKQVFHGQDESHLAAVEHWRVDDDSASIRKEPTRGKISGTTQKSTRGSRRGEKDLESEDVSDEEESDQSSDDSEDSNDAKTSRKNQKRKGSYRR